MSYLGPTLRQKRRSARPWRRALFALLVSLALNGVILTQVEIGFFGNKGATQFKKVDLAPLTASQWSANRAVTEGVHAATSRTAPAPLEERAAVPAAERQPVRLPGQVVDVAPSANSTPPKDTRFVSDRNNTVEKETRSRHARAGYERTLPVPSEPKGVAKNAVQKGPTRAGDSGKAGGGKKGDGKSGPTRVADGEPRVPDRSKQERLALQFDPNGIMASESKEDGVVPDVKPDSPGDLGTLDGAGIGQGGKAGPIDPSRLLPGAATYEKIAGGPAPDHLDGVEEGEGTYLNTREWKYATYFNRVKQAVASRWDPRSALSTRDPTGKRFAYKDRITLVQVTLDEQGVLKNVAVEKTCGVDFLDETAVDAFRKAQPFVHPPPGLVDERREIRFSFGFYLEVGSPLRIFRGPMLGD